MKIIDGQRVIPITFTVNEYFFQRHSPSWVWVHTASSPSLRHHEAIQLVRESFNALSMDATKYMPFCFPTLWALMDRDILDEKTRNEILSLATFYKIMD